MKKFSFSGEDLPLATSRLGGLPDLPPGFAWPEGGRKGQEGPLPFLLQINLAEASPYDSEHILPKQGMLYFFYDSEGLPSGIHPDHFGAWRVVYYGGHVHELVPTLRPGVQPIPDPGHPDYYPSDFEALRLKFAKSGCLARLADPFCGGFCARYSGVRVGYKRKHNPRCWDNRLLGRPNPIQGDMEDECQKNAPAGESDWRLLFQLDSNSEAEMTWSDCGMLYFWIREKDLKERNFENVWMRLQCC